MGAKWTEDEIALAADERISGLDLIELTGRSAESVYAMRHRLRSGKYKGAAAPSWTPEEDTFILNTSHLSGEQVARQLGRTERAVSHRRVRLGVAGDVGHWAKNNPNFVGTRRLLARTCATCDMLLDASWFGRSRPGRRRPPAWHANCAPCHYRKYAGRYSIPRTDERAAAARERRARLQELSLPSADRHGEPYVEADMRVLADPELTLLEKAVTLQRTYHAVALQVSKHGFDSKVGRGDPTKGQWRITFPRAELAA